MTCSTRCGGDALVLEVVTSLLAAATPARIEGQEAVYRGGVGDESKAIEPLRSLLAGAGW